MYSVSYTRWVSPRDLYSTDPVINNTVLCINLLRGRYYVKCSYHTQKNNKEGRRKFCRWWVCLWHKLWWWFHECTLICKLIKFYFLNLYSFLYVSHTSKCFKQNTPLFLFWLILWYELFRSMLFSSQIFGIFLEIFLLRFLILLWSEKILCMT